MYIAFHKGSHSSDPLELQAMREAQYCENIGIPFLAVENEQGHSVWAYLWPAAQVSPQVRARSSDLGAPHYAMLAAHCPFQGTVATTTMPFRGDFKDWAKLLKKSALSWSYEAHPELVGA